MDKKNPDGSYKCKNVTGQIVRAGGSLGGRIVWLKMSLRQFVGRRINSAPETQKVPTSMSQDGICLFTVSSSIRGTYWVHKTVEAEYSGLSSLAGPFLNPGNFVS
jgi:hypothetical protein